MKVKINCVLIILLLLFSFVPFVNAEYVLPYPSYMPGNKLYTVSRIVDRISKYWYWGSIASLKYHLKMSDKYLIEAKTLFEYKQYLLAVDALKRSNGEFQKTPQSLLGAKKEGKDIIQLEKTVKEATQTHVYILNRLRETMPTEFNWTPEKQKPITLRIGSLLEKSIQVRLASSK